MCSPCVHVLFETLYSMRVGLGHSLANKTVVQLRPKSTTGSSFFLEYNRDFCRRVWSITKQFEIL